MNTLGDIITTLIVISVLGFLSAFLTERSHNMDVAGSAIVPYTFAALSLVIATAVTIGYALFKLVTM